MKKIVFSMMMLIAVGSLTTLQAASNENEQIIRSRGAVEQITNRMIAQLALSEPQGIEVLELNHEYYFLFEGDAPKQFTDRQYRKSWNSYERKLRRILSDHQYSLYLAERGRLFVSPRISIPHAYVPNPSATPRSVMPQRGNGNRPMAQAPRGNRQNPDLQRQNNNERRDLRKQNQGNNNRLGDAKRPNVNDQKSDVKDKIDTPKDNKEKGEL